MAQSRRKTFLILGFVFAGLAMCSFAISMLVYISSLISLTEGSSYMVVSFSQYLSPIINFCLVGVLVVEGIMHLSTAGQIKKAGVSGTWCARTGIGDFLLAASVLLVFSGSIIRPVLFLLMQALNGDYDIIEAVIDLVFIVSALFCAAGGVMYFIAGFSQKEAGKINILLVISGCALCLAALLTLFLQVFFMMFTIEMMYLLQILYACILFAGRGLRGFAPLTYPKYDALR